MMRKLWLARKSRDMIRFDMRKVQLLVMAAAMMPLGGFVGCSGVVASQPSPWMEVTARNGVKDDCYPLQADPAKCSFRFRVSRTAKNTIGVEAYVRDDKVVVDDCEPGSVSCPTWRDDCLEVFFDGDGDRNPNTRGPEWNSKPTPCNAGGEYAIAANGATQSDYASAKKCFGREWGGVAEPWMENGRRVGKLRLAEEAKAERDRLNQKKE